MTSNYLAEDCALTIWQHLEHILPRLNSQEKMPVWPPDVFALCASLLVKSGSYGKVLANWPPPEYDVGHEAKNPWLEASADFGKSWRVAWAANQPPPTRAILLWNTLVNARHEPVHAISGNLSICRAILELCAIADEASEGIGSPLYGYETPSDELFLYHAAELLDRDLLGSSVCEEIHASRIRVLPKMHTPQSGLTIRSLSIYLALCQPSEVIPRWIQSASPLRGESINLLVVPWPFEVYPAQFRETEALSPEMRNMPDEFGFFTYSQRNTGDVLATVKNLFDAAVEQVGRVDGVVLPELAVTPQERNKLRSQVLKRNAFLVCGFGSKSQGRKRHGMNEVGLDFGIPPLEVSLSQAKHHRWKLDSSQIYQYRLGSLLYPEKQWWEHISVEERRFVFASVHAAMVLTALICEDLARPDPVGDLLRAVGPNLVIAILMDGPQLKERWAGRFATTLADDPGCSVLSVTSLGMSKLSRPREGATRQRIVGLWKDARSGGPVEIALDDGHDGVVLSLSMRYIEEWSADGRSDNGNAAYPILSGVHCLKAQATSPGRVKTAAKKGFRKR